MTSQSYNNVDFKLHTLGWKAFQDLSVTIMTDIFGHDVQSFYDSHDGGRDGAYHGVWIDKKNGSKSGSFTAQCKFTSDYKKGVKVYDLKEDIEKAKRLANKGLSNHYVLFTNSQLTGNQEESLREVFENIEGIESFTAYGKERISQIILESPKLRMLVPRIYGLGDLSQILDERAGHQAKAILDSLGDDISKFVLTEAFNKSAKALVEHGFVLLLGEPACGKSTIAASLSLGALDEWGCSTFKICSSDEFTQHWNPNEPKRLFWIDDAFGATQVDWGATFGWARVFPHINTAIRNGAKVIFTSRDYIYKSAKGDLKESDLPVLKASQVVINVQDISDLERQQILYNHIKLGNQSKNYKEKIKPYLSEIAKNKKFTPEIARRLGNIFFTKSLIISKPSLINFVENPIQFLIDVLSSLEKQNFSALAVIFMRAGVLPSPIVLSDDENKALKLLGGTLDGVISSLKYLKGSLTTLNFEEDQNVWRFKHPSIRDAFAQYVANDVELLEIYLGGAPLTKLFQEVACASIKMDGLKVIVPKSHYEIIIRRMEFFDKKSYYNHRLFNGFLTKRCDKQFLLDYLDKNPDFLDQLEVRESIFRDSDINVFIKFYEEGLLPEQRRVQVVKSLHDIALSDYDTQFTKDDIKKIFKKDEFELIKFDICNKVIPDLESIIDDLSSDYDDEYEPEDHFSDLNHSLCEYEDLFYENSVLRTQISTAKNWVEEEIQTLSSARKNILEGDDKNYKATMSSNIHIDRSIFDDVDS
jgi:hypothetical protein